MELKRGTTAWTEAARPLLIVPYGIETFIKLVVIPVSFAFNCTLWNWNKAIREKVDLTNKLLIVPYGIETSKAPFFRDGALAFNCTLWNWNKGELVFAQLPADF